MNRYTPMLTEAQAAKYINMSCSYLQKSRSINKHQVSPGPSYVKVGRRVFYRKEDLNLWIKERFILIDLSNS